MHNLRASFSGSAGWVTHVKLQGGVPVNGMPSTYFSQNLLR
jgi:hypothetical protein